MKCYYPDDLEKSMVIYKITDLIDGKVYIGQTINKLKRRFSRLRFNRFLKRTIKLHGIKNFELSIIQSCSSINELNEREQFWISFYDSTDNRRGYNLQSGGKNCRVHESTKKVLSKKCSGWHHTERAKQKISEAQMGSKHWAYGKKFSSKYKENLSKSHMGNRHSQATKDKMSKTRKGRAITWGSKISEAKYKVAERGVLDFILKNPYAVIRDIMEHFKLKSNGPIHRLGGLRQLRQKALGTTKILCPLCRESFKSLNNTHLKYIHGLQTTEKRHEMLLSFG